MIRIILILILLLSSNFIFGAENKTQEQVTKKSNLFNEFEQQAKLNDTDKINDKLFNKLTEAKIEYYIESYKNRHLVFYWQYISSIIIFFLVITIVITGIVFSGIQFYIALKNNNDTSQTEIEVTVGSIKVNSSFLGIIILVISISFFYLYLVFVYPISEINSSNVDRIKMDSNDTSIKKDKND